jgi:hypothetical protein
VVTLLVVPPVWELVLALPVLPELLAPELVVPELVVPDVVVLGLAVVVVEVDVVGVVLAEPVPVTADVLAVLRASAGS